VTLANKMCQAIILDDLCSICGDHVRWYQDPLTHPDVPCREASVRGSVGLCVTGMVKTFESRVSALRCDSCIFKGLVSGMAKMKI